MERALDRHAPPARAALMRAAGAERGGIAFVGAFAQGGLVAIALEARAARDRPVEHDRLAGLQPRHIVSDRFDDTGALVPPHQWEIGRASWRERGCQYV